ncbi:hypothetical protein BBP40_006167 [Aspergillus hancockii]|nr:hypothetical protein BBP40_006167 [Aspergillus hancockii]
MLTDHLKRSGINVLFLNAAIFAKTVLGYPRAFASLKTFFTGGEVVNMGAIRHTLEHGGPERFFHLYGVTECTVVTSIYQVSLEDADRQTLPLGRPLSNTFWHILDESFHQVKDNEVGELFVGGESVSGGYLNDTDKSAMAFVTVHGLPGEEQQLLYRTGDLVRRDESGLVFFVCRKDSQIKIKGHRVELESIEELLMRTTPVSAAVALPIHLEHETIIVAFVIVAPETFADSHTVLRGFTENSDLPTVLRVEIVAGFPLTANGKVDRHLMTQQYTKKLMTGLVARKQHRPAVMGVREKLELIWNEILCPQKQNLAAEDDFFSLGGGSLQVSTLIYKIHRVFDLTVPYRCPYQHPTLGSLSRFIELSLHSNSANHDDERRQWITDSMLGKGLQPTAGTIRDWRASNEGRVFLSGGTGFVGSGLLKSLIQMPQVKLVICLIRANDSLSGLRRLRKAFQKYGLPEKLLDSKVEILPGDLGKHNLGLSQEDFERVASCTSGVFHVGAHVDYTMPYSKLRSPNVLGTLHMLTLSNTIRPKSFHHFSTIEAYGATQGYFRSVAQSYEDDQLDDAIETLGYEMGYTQSKWVAEKIAWNAVQNGLPVTIYRLGETICSMESGATNPDTFWDRLMKACIQMGSYPIVPRHLANFSCLDFVVSSSLQIASSIENAGHAYNLITPRIKSSLPTEEAFNILSRKLPFPLKGLSYPEWVQKVDFSVHDPLKPFIPVLEDKIHEVYTLWELEMDSPVYRTDNLDRALADHPEVYLKSATLEEMLERCLARWVS